MLDDDQYAFVLDEIETGLAVIQAELQQPTQIARSARRGRPWRIDRSMPKAVTG